ncbi:hypothetical protein C8R48DRAFT_773066 [Suillus tomentosus]|nr:hypothetical protein C8R48DRAFT_773066 [Suillus tomentosus]
MLPVKGRCFWEVAFDLPCAVRNPPHNPQEVVRDPRDFRDPAQHDPRYPPRSNSREALHSHDHHYIRTYSQEPARALDRDALHPRDAFYYRDSRNPRYVSPQDLYGSGDIRAESDLNTRDSSPMSDFHGNYGLGTYRPHRDDLDEREQSLSPYRSRHVGGGHYRESRYPQGPSRRFQDSRWDDAAHFDYGHDGVPRGFSRDRPPRPPPAA